MPASSSGGVTATPAGPLPTTIASASEPALGRGVAVCWWPRPDVTGA